MPRQKQHPGLIYDDLDPMLMASDPEATAPMTYKQGYYEMPFHRKNPVARKAARQNRSSYESICTDPVDTPTPSFSEDTRTERVQVSEEPQYMRFSRKPAAQRSSYEHAPTSFSAARQSASRLYPEDQVEPDVHPPMPRAENQYAPSYTSRPHYRSNSHFDCIPEEAQSFHTSCNSPAYSHEQSYDRHMGHHMVEHHSRSESMIEPSSYSRASLQDDVSYYAGPPSHSLNHPRREQSLALQHMSRSVSEMPREQLSHSTEFDQGPSHQVHPGYSPHPSRGRQHHHHTHQVPQHVVQPSSVNQRYDIYIDHRMPTDGDEYSRHEQSMASRVVHENADYHRSRHAADCHRPPTSACSDGRMRIVDHNLSHNTQERMHSNWTYVPAAQFHTQDEASFGGNAACLDRAPDVPVAPVAKRIVFIQETGQKKSKRSKTKAATPSAEQTDTPTVIRFISNN